MTIEFSRQILEKKSSNITFHQNPSSESQFFPYGMTFSSVRGCLFNICVCKNDEPCFLCGRNFLIYFLLKLLKQNFKVFEEIAAPVNKAIHTPVQWQELVCCLFRSRLMEPGLMWIRGCQSKDTLKDVTKVSDGQWKSLWCVQAKPYLIFIFPTCSEF